MNRIEVKLPISATDVCVHNFERRAASMDAWSATAVRPAPASSPLSVVSGPPRAEHTDATETRHV